MMKSKISIEIDFDTGKPYIKVVNQTQSEDVRDNLVTYFHQLLGGESNWCRLTFYPALNNGSGNVLFRIDPIGPDQLEANANELNNLLHFKSQFVPQPSIVEPKQ